jgi:uncharacterized protein with NRDE domain
MCLIFVAWKVRADYRLVVAANRDEFYGRPTAPAGFWADAPEVLAGRDLEGGGTWLGVSRAGRFAALTNYRRGAGRMQDAPTRGRLVSDFLLSETTPGDYMQSLAPRASIYNGFNLLAGDGESLYWFSNRGGAPLELEAGVHAVSNDLLDTPWPKVLRGKASFERLLAENEIDKSAIFDLLLDRRPAADASLPDTGIGLERERALSPIFITAGDYGTRSSTVLLVDAGGDVEFEERTHEPGRDPGSDDGGALRYAFRIESSRETAC